jgi:L-lactate dehydrogenase complex protein LldF
MTHSNAAQQFNLDEPRVNWHDEALWFIREKRDIAVKQIPEWEKLRGVASDIKDNVLTNLDVYLTEFEANATQNGIKIHWAADASEHNRIVWKKTASK